MDHRGRGHGPPPLGAVSPGQRRPLGLSGRWLVQWRNGPAAELHQRPEPEGPTIAFLSVRAPALVLGSTQPDTVVDPARAEAAGVGVARRRSGGGAVLLRPGEVVWADVFVPAGDRLWSPDVSRAGRWLGRAWAAALDSLGFDPACHEGPSVATAWSATVCFAGLAPGEVTIGGRKVVGVSQRRTRAGARFQCAALLRWEPAALVDLLAIADAEREAAVEALSPLAAAVDAPGSHVERALLEQLGPR